MTPARVIRISAILLGVWGNSAAVAEEVYTWTDGDGVTHFSQWAPDNADKVSTLIVNASNPPDYDPQEDPYSIRNQANRVNETWQMLEEKRNERRERRLAARERGARTAQPAYVAYPYYSSPSYFRPVQRQIHRPAHQQVARHGNFQLHQQLQRPGLVSQVQQHQSRATRRNQYDPFRSAQISAPESGRQVHPGPPD